MNARLTSKLLVSGLIRRANAQGGFAMVLRKGDEISGTIVLHLVQNGANLGLFERMVDLDGHATLSPCGPQNITQDTEINEYIERRGRADPDLWVVELDIVNGERFAAETICAG